MEDYSEGPSGLQTVELTEGSGTAVKEGDLVTVCQAALPSVVNKHSHASYANIHSNQSLAR